MYIPRAFAVDEREALHELLELSPLVQLISMTAGGLVASALPMMAVEHDGALVLHGHFARSNEHWKTFDPSIDTLAVVTGPDAYVTPNSYATKQATHQVVPTWNYESVHARGPLTIHDDAAWVEAFVSRLTDQHEQGQPKPWSVSDAPRDYLDIRFRGIVGVELHVTSLQAKAKLSQDKSADDWAGVKDAFAVGTPSEQVVASRMVNRPLST